MQSSIQTLGGGPVSRCGPSHVAAPCCRGDARGSQARKRWTCMVSYAVPVPDSTQQQDAVDLAHPAASQEQPSTLQLMVDRSMQQGRSERPRRPPPKPPGNTPAPSSPYWRVSGRKQMVIAADVPAGRMAGSLAALLRAHGCADVSLFSVISIFKCLKVLALANIFLGQHGSDCTFVFSRVTAKDHQDRLTQLLKHQQAAHGAQEHLPQSRQGRLLPQVPDPRPGLPPAQSSRRQESDGQQQQQQQQQLGNRGFTAQQPQQTPASQQPQQHGHDQQQRPQQPVGEGQQQPRSEPYTPGQGPEPVPELPLSAFKLHVWASPGSLDPGHSTQGSKAAAAMAGVQRLDFALDMRQHWNRLAYLCFDTALSIADSLFRQLMSQVPPQARHAPETTTSTQSHAASTNQQGVATPVNPAQPAHAQHSNGDVPHAPTMLYDVDSNQAVLIFLSLSLVQQRLNDQGIPFLLTVSALRHEPNSPRLDGRNGWLLKLQLQPLAKVERYLKLKRPYKKKYNWGQKKPKATGSQDRTTKQSGQDSAATQSNQDRAPKQSNADREPKQSTPRHSEDRTKATLTSV